MIPSLDRRPCLSLPWRLAGLAPTLLLLVLSLLVLPLALPQAAFANSSTGSPTAASANSSKDLSHQAEATAGAPGGPPLVLAGALVYPVSQAPFEGSILIQDGSIQAVGEALSIPTGAQVVELEGKHVFPGFILASSVLGLTEIGSVDGTVDNREIGSLHPDLRVESSYNADSLLLPVSAAGGVLTTHVIPGGGLVAGTSAVMRVATRGSVGRVWEGAVVRAPAGLHLRFPRTEPPAFSFFGEPPTQEEVEKDFREALESLDNLLTRARHHNKLLQDGLATAGSAPRLEALAPVLSGELPIFLHARYHRQIQAALDWAEEAGLENLVLVAKQEVRGFAERLAKAGIPVILEGIQTLPERDSAPYDAPYTVAADLQRAGVTFAIADSGSRFHAANARNLPFHAGMTTAFGLDAADALAAITARPAEILGLEDLGTLEAGKEATLVVADGPPLEATTRILRAWQQGWEIELEDNHHHRLYREYRQRRAPSTQVPSQPAASSSSTPGPGDRP